LIQAVEFLLQFAEKSEDNPFAQEAALQLLAKTHDSSTTQNQREIGHYIFIKSNATFDAAMAAHRLVQLADVSGGKPTVQQLAISAVMILATLHPSSKSALGTKLHRLLHFADSSQDRKLQQLALSAFQKVVDCHPENQSAAGEAAVHRLLQLAETSGAHPSQDRKLQQLALSAFQKVVDCHPENQSAAGEAAVHRLLQLAETSGAHPDVQTKALSAFAAVVSDHEANQSAAGPTAVSCLLKLSHPSGDEPYVQKDALQALRVVVVNHAGNTAALTAAGDAAAHGLCVLSDL
jgi:ureidoglycolate hydrolase